MGLLMDTVVLWSSFMPQTTTLAVQFYQVSSEPWYPMVYPRGSGQTEGKTMLSA